MHRHSGFTLIETLIYLVIMAGFLALLTRIFFSVLDVQLESNATTYVQQDGRFILSRISYDTRRAAGIVTPAANGQSGAVLALTIGGLTYTYSLAAGDLQLVSPSGTDVLNGIGTTVTAFSIYRLGGLTGPGSLKISFIITGTALPGAGLTESKTYYTTVDLR